MSASTPGSGRCSRRGWLIALIFMLTNRSNLPTSEEDQLLSVQTAAGQAESPHFMPRHETDRHLELKRLALAWARENGCTIAAAEVSAPHLGRTRLDVAAYRPPPRSVGLRKNGPPVIGVTLIFECKQSRGDFLHDARRESEINDRLKKLRERQVMYEESMQLRFPSLRRGDTLFPEFDAYDFAAAGHPPYDDLIAEIERLSRQLHERTKFDRLARWRAANLHYVVAEPDVAEPHELPAGWGLLTRAEAGLDVVQPAIWQEAPEQHRWTLLLRIGMSGTRSVHRDLGVAATPC